MGQGRVCDRCSTIFASEHRANDETEKEHYKDGTAFIKTAELAHCYFCTWLWRQYRWRPLRSGELIPIHHTTYKLDFEGADIKSLGFHTYENESQVSFVIVFMARKGDIPGLHCVSKLNPSPNFEQARKWLQTCNSDHPECGGWQKQRKLPTRLVNVRQDKSTSKLTANICRGATLPIGTPYLSLSHCWGTVKFVTTTRNNLAQFESGLPVDLLSRTVQDALRITLELQMEYIWIDSLCIIQDDTGDWEGEASHMGEVYQNASCNISASGVADGKHGFMRPRFFDPTPIFKKISLSATNEAMTGSTLVDTYCFALSHPEKEIAESPLFTRAWTLQEQILASRALHFGEDQMFWECNRTFANEVWPRGWDNDIFAKHFVERHQTDINWQFSFGQFEQDKAASLKVWYNIVTHYSRRHVTFRTDWLPALAGLAAKFASHLEDTYAYGLWNKDLLRGLVFAQLGGTFAPRSSKVSPNWSGIPSWSWAALYKPVIWWGDPGDSETVELCTFRMLHRPTTPVLELTGMLLSLTSDHFTSMYLWNARETPKGSRKDGFDITVQFDQWFFANFEDDWIDSQNADAEDARNRGLRDCRAAVLWVPIHLYGNCDFQFTADGGEGDSHAKKRRARTATGLLLCMQPDLEHGQYRRAGVCDMVVTADEDIEDKDMLNEIRAYGQLHASPAVHATLDDGQHVISVV